MDPRKKSRGLQRYSSIALTLHLKSLWLFKWTPASLAFFVVENQSRCLITPDGVHGTGVATTIDINYFNSDWGYISLLESFYNHYQI